MARARTLKPDFFTNENLADCSPHARLLFAGLWTLADRSGRLEDRPKKIHAQIFPYEVVKIDDLLSELSTGNFIVRYVVDGVAIIKIPAFSKHQYVNNKERLHDLPSEVSETSSDEFENSQKNPKISKQEYEPQGGSYIGIKVKGKKEERESEGDSEPCPLWPKCSHFRMTPDEYPRVLKAYQKNNLTAEDLGIAIAEVDRWLEGDDTKPRKARARKTSHYRFLNATWVLDNIARRKRALANATGAPVVLGSQRFTGNESKLLKKLNLEKL